MSFLSNFERLCNQKCYSPHRVCKELNISTGSYSNWKNRGNIPHPSTLKKIADYFGVSVEYLLADNEEISPSKTDELKVALFGGDEEITDEMWEEVKQFAQFVKQRKKGERK